MSTGESHVMCCCPQIVRYILTLHCTSATVASASIETRLGAHLREAVEHDEGISKQLSALRVVMLTSPYGAIVAANLFLHLTYRSTLKQCHP